MRYLMLLLTAFAFTACGDSTPNPDDIPAQLIGSWELKSFQVGSEQPEDISFEQVFVFHDTDSLTIMTGNEMSSHIEKNGYSLEGTYFKVNELEGNISSIDENEFQLDLVNGELSNITYIYRRKED